VAKPDRDRPRLSLIARDRLLARLRMSAPQVDFEGLSALVRAWLMNMPFHNIDLLAASLADCRSLTPDEALNRCESGLGGPCHVHALGFVSLLEACGFAADLCSATIAHEADHLLVRVTVGSDTCLCDVGNGQPYLAPFRLDRVTEVTHLGWRVRSEPTVPGIRLRRWSPDLPDGKVVYDATPEPRNWTCLAEVIARHHAQPAFGPFMTGLRAVRIQEHRLDTLRDDLWTTYERDGHVSRVMPEDALRDLLLDVFRLQSLPLDDALRAWRKARVGAHS
jgi:arylamine N-acetyltransferase